MTYLILDTETTIKSNGSPFNRNNKLCFVGLLDSDDRSLIFDIEHGGLPYNQKLCEIKKAIEATDLLIGFNIKFDLHWIRRYVDNIKFPPVWDCQLGAFILSNQTTPYPSLDESCSKHGIRGKLSNIATEYWENGIDTTEIPEQEIREYLANDLAITKELYIKQQDLLKDNTLFKLQCSDLLVLEEMEYNGLKFDVEKAKTEATSIEAKLINIDAELQSIVGVGEVNWNSSSQLSAILYGGTLKIPATINTTRVLKSGEIKHGTKQGFNHIPMPALVAPDPKNETKPTKGWSDFMLKSVNAGRAKEGLEPHERIYSVSKQTLLSLKANKKTKGIIDLLLRRSEMEKLLTTYFRGIPESMQELGVSDYIHGQFNQCVARTGRLSSSNPNLQNIAKDVKKLFLTRY